MKELRNLRDTGTVTGGTSTRASSGSDAGRRELQIITVGLRASAVRVFGDDPGRLAGRRARAGGRAWPPCRRRQSRPVWKRSAPARVIVKRRTP
jgi:hypothetical protein